MRRPTVSNAPRHAMSKGPAMPFACACGFASLCIREAVSFIPNCSCAHYGWVPVHPNAHPVA
eukprot:2569018-Prymnesium_polylepis.1